MIDHFDETAASLLAIEGGRDSSDQVAAAAAQVLEKLARHFAQLVGDLGARTLLARSLSITGATFPWLAIDGVSVDPTWTALRTSLTRQDVETATEAFGMLLS